MDSLIAFLALIEHKAIVDGIECVCVCVCMYTHIR